MTAVIPADLPALALAINRAHVEAREYASKAVERALQAGDLLIAVKGQLAHGEFGPWCAEHLPEISRRTLQDYIRVAKEFPAEMRSAAFLPSSLRKALKLASRLTSDELDSKRDAGWYVCSASYLGVILRDAEHSFGVSRSNFSRFCEAVWSIPGHLFDWLMNDESHAARCRFSVLYESVNGWDGWDELIGFIDGRLAIVYGDTTEGVAK